MKIIHTAPVLAAVALMAGCSKPAETATTAAGDATAAASDTASNAMAPGGAVSPPEGNDAVNSDLNTSESGVAPASNSFTEDQAKGHIENAGYSDVSNLMKTPDGLWTAQAKKDGKSVDVSVDFKGAVTSK